MLILSNMCCFVAILHCITTDNRSTFITLGQLHKNLKRLIHNKGSPGGMYGNQ